MKYGVVLPFIICSFICCFSLQALEVVKKVSSFDVEGNVDSFSYECVDDASLFEQKELGVKEFIHSIMTLLVSMVEKENQVNKEMLNLFIAQELGEFIANNKITFKRTVNSSDNDEETMLAIDNFSELMASFFKVVKDPDNSDNVAKYLTGMFSNLVNIAMLATKSGKFDAQVRQELTNSLTRSIKVISDLNS